MSAPARIRMSRTALLPVGLLVICMLPLATVSAWTLLLLLVPAAIATWVVRVGVDVGDDGVIVRSAFGRRLVPWARVAGIRVAPRGELRLVTTARTEVRLPVLRARDLPRLAAVSGGRIDVPVPPA
ncbi:PH domain-containing protein [Blastococcus deserti]|uniref:PH domain-containing protein n=1 Tax=Blastococcus deserti TaxID=2259033 RepID=A0ABW4X8E7_9ACTN